MRDLNKSFRSLPNINSVWASLIVEELYRQGVENVFVAPGSRSGPLALAVARHPGMKSIVHFDERGLAFYALGFVSASGQPAALICTSGTAAANFLPAIVETSRKKLPLIVLTADRPPELQKNGTMQTIDQPGLYTSYVRCYLEVPCPDVQIPAEFVLTTIAQAVSRAKGELPGPVHLNCAFREPLASQKRSWPRSSYLSSIDHWLKSEKPYTQYLLPTREISTLALEEVISRVRNIKRGLIVVGKLKGSQDASAVMQLAEATGFPVFPDISSGLRLGEDHAQIIHHFDQILLSTKVRRRLKFDGVIHFGGRMTSKRFYEFIGQDRPAEYISVLGHALRSDPQHQVTLRVVTSVSGFCRRLLPLLDHAMPSEDLVVLQQLEKKVAATLDRALSQPQISEPGLAYELSRNLPAASGLFLGNSMPIRDMDMFALGNARQAAVFGNRGASGIDGLIATAAGVARGSKKVVTAVLGDVSFLHDLNSLLLLRTLKEKLIVVVVNNDGGGIFSFLPSAAERASERMFATPHGMTLGDLVKSFGLRYLCPQTSKDFVKAYGSALKSKGSCIIEVRTRRSDNFKMHCKLQDLIIKTLGGEQ